jgi:hypothetical protein
VPSRLSVGVCAFDETREQRPATWFRGQRRGTGTARRRAMKPINRKRLHLGIETLCTLDRAELTRVIGGVDMGDGPGGGGQGEAARTSVVSCPNTCAFCGSR